MSEEAPRLRKGDQVILFGTHPGVVASGPIHGKRGIPSIKVTIVVPLSGVALQKRD